MTNTMHAWFSGIGSDMEDIVLQVGATVRDLLRLATNPADKNIVEKGLPPGKSIQVNSVDATLDTPLAHDSIVMIVQDVAGA